MPFCTQCGNQVGTTDRYCAKCGGLQAAAAAGASATAGSAAYAYPILDATARLQSVDNRTASILCYIPIVGWIMCIVVLASAKYRDDLDTRFHDFQGLYLFVAWLIADLVFVPLHVLPFHFMFGFHLGGVLKALIMVAWIFMLIKVSHRERFKLPVIGDLAEKSVSEQRV